MARQLPSPPHGVRLSEALPHFNAEFRHRYRLPALLEPWLQARVPDIEERLAGSTEARNAGVVDPGCATLARVALEITPRYAIGMLDGTGRAHVLAPHDVDLDAYLSGHVILVNPLGGVDNWGAVSSWVRRHGSDGARRTQLAGLASQSRPDEAANTALLRQAVEDGRGAIVLPPDEGFNAELAAEVGYIYGVTPDTLKRWKRERRSDLATRTRGAPKRSRSR